MAKIEIYYDYYDSKLCPQWMIIHFGSKGIDWKKRYMYIPLAAPFKRKTSEEFMDLEMMLTITLVDLVMNPDKEHQIGVNLNSVVNRVNKMRGEGSFPYDISDVSTFILQVSDIEDVAAMDRNELFAWR
ncbi:hypothetical protein NV379_02320 [Paenibacillus sp. N1-5-1-14]|uniref:hypothetical protein n=1 Tax=Paenibacillus radicibacter TaxID=2972488 RepID=UPI0021598A5A|nr:hypothetical protein [Paenibacillus radicibacter]MCR8641482.1 hypothetical protein [Paenibacillus radicibacter]